MGARLSILKAAIRERFSYDLGALGGFVAWGTFGLAKLLLHSRSAARRATGFDLLLRLHGAGWSKPVDRRVLNEIRRATATEKNGQSTGLWLLYDRTIRAAVQAFYAGADPDPRRLIGAHIFIVKSASPSERGVLVADYSYTFPLLAGLFDLPAIAERYTIVLEPSWAGSCRSEILQFSRLARPVYVETIEPRDRDLLASLGTNVSAVPVAANWWIDPRSAPSAGGARDIDVIMVAAWADIKRHWRVFKVLSRLRRLGHRLKIALVGYSYDRTKADIEALATYFGIRDQIEAYEHISQDEVSALLRRSKIHVLWSRRECANRAIIEAMIADVPVIVREGLTFGFKYPYINDQTGRFVREHELGDAILDMVANRDRYQPRTWVLERMTCERATEVLEHHLRAHAEAEGAPWTERLAVKTSTLYSQMYFDPGDRERFQADYEFLESCLRPRTSA